MTKKHRRPVGETIGGILVGFDQQILRDLPPAQELVQQSRPLRGVVALGDGRDVVFPDDEPEVAGDLGTEGGPARDEADQDQPTDAGGEGG